MAMLISVLEKICQESQNRHKAILGPNAWY